MSEKIEISRTLGEHILSTLLQCAFDCESEKLGKSADELATKLHAALYPLLSGNVEEGEVK